SANPCLFNKHPRSMTYGRDRLLVLNEMADECDGFLVHSQPVGIHHPAWQQPCIIVLRVNIFEGTVDCEFFAPLFIMPSADIVPRRRYDVGLSAGSFKRPSRFS